MGIYSVMFYGGLVLSILFLIASIIIFFVMKIPSAFGIVTGRTQKKAIEEIRAGGNLKKTKRKVKQSDILVRDVDVSGMSSAPLKSGRVGKTGAMEEARKRAEEDARVEAERAEAERIANEEQAAKEQATKLEEQSTDLLTYNDMKNKNKTVPTGEETTSVLDEESDTDILKFGSEKDSVMDDDLDTEIEDYGRTIRGASVKMQPKEKVSIDEEAETDVLRNKPKGNIVPDADVTDVLVSPNIGLDSNNNDIYGTVSPDTTSVLRTDIEIGADSVRPAGKRALPEITVIYSETVVHTDESL